MSSVGVPTFNPFGGGDTGGVTVNGSPADILAATLPVSYSSAKGVTLVALSVATLGAETPEAVAFETSAP